jgi:hypothetical protein
LSREIVALPTVCAALVRAEIASWSALLPPGPLREAAERRLWADLYKSRRPTPGGGKLGHPD